MHITAMVHADPLRRRIDGVDRELSDKVNKA